MGEKGEKKEKYLESSLRPCCGKFMRVLGKKDSLPDDRSNFS